MFFAADEVLIQVCRPSVNMPVGADPSDGLMWLDVIDFDGYRFAQGLRQGLGGSAGRWDSTTDEVLQYHKGSAVHSPEV